MKSRILYMYCILHLLKARTTTDNIFLSHSYILLFPPKSPFSMTLILICITLSLITLLRNHFSFPFITLHCTRNVFFKREFELFIACDTAYLSLVMQMLKMFLDFWRETSSQKSHRPFLHSALQFVIKAVCST